MPKDKASNKTGGSGANKATASDGAGVFRQKKKKASVHSRANQRKQRVTNDVKEIQDLQKAVIQHAPPKGDNPLSADFAKKEKDSSSKKGTDKGDEKTAKKAIYSGIRRFAELPISDRTKKALAETKKFITLTDIQRAAIPHALAGRDVLGAARTGSGKTLAYIIPLIEKLYRAGWQQMDGTGALVISPTRELAGQIFDNLRMAGKHHSYSAALLIGGKSGGDVGDFKSEQERVIGINILVCTPGRLLQHMEQTYGFECPNLQILVLDEADRLLDMGFSESLNHIVQNLPTTRQTLLFSATQTKSVRDLARLSLNEPQYIAVHDADEAITSSRLQQHYMIIGAERKLDLLFSFLKTHLKTKTIVFCSSCKQTRYMFEVFRRLRPGVPLMHLHGKMKQDKRMSLYYEFCGKQFAVMFATDLAARGLDFPDVDWVVQMDCPESPETYIHRVGRTARYRNKGHALLFLAPSELAMVDALTAAKVPIKKVKADEEKMRSTAEHFRGYLAEDPDLKYLAQKAFVSYLRSVYLQSNKKVFNVNALPIADIADRMGLAGAPRVKFLQNQPKKGTNKGGADGAATTEEGDEVSDSSDDEGKTANSGKKSSSKKTTKVDSLTGNTGDDDGIAAQGGSMNAAKNMPHALRAMIKEEELRKKRKATILKIGAAAAAAAEARGADPEEAADIAMEAAERRLKGAAKRNSKIGPGSYEKGERGAADAEDYDGLIDDDLLPKERRTPGKSLQAQHVRLLKRKGQVKHNMAQHDSDEDASDDDALMKIKRHDHDLADGEEPKAAPAHRKKAITKETLEGAGGRDADEPSDDEYVEARTAPATVKGRVQERDSIDKLREKARIHAKHQAEKKAEKKRVRRPLPETNGGSDDDGSDGGDDVGVSLANAEPDENSFGTRSSSDNEDSDNNDDNDTYDAKAPPSSRAAASSSSATAAAASKGRKRAAVTAPDSDDDNDNDNNNGNSDDDDDAPAPPLRAIAAAAAAKKNTKPTARGGKASAGVNGNKRQRQSSATTSISAMSLKEQEAHALRMLGE